jgi:hypothetical protein
MARAVQSSAARMLGLGEQPPHDMVTFPLQQTACPAIVVEYPSISVLEEELRLGEPWYQRRQAYAVFTGILAHYGVADTTRLTIQLGGGGSYDNWLVTVDGTWRLLSDPDGQATFVGLARDRMHALELRRKGARKHTWVPYGEPSRSDTVWVSVSFPSPAPVEETP